MDGLGPVGPEYMPPAASPDYYLRAAGAYIANPGGPRDANTSIQRLFKSASVVYNAPVLSRRSVHEHLPLRSDDAIRAMRVRVRRLVAGAGGAAARTPSSKTPLTPDPVRITVDWLDGPLWVMALDAQYSTHIYHASTRLLALYDAQVGSSARRRMGCD